MIASASSAAGMRAQLLERLQVEHDDRLVIAGRCEAMTARQCDCRSVRTLDACHLAQQSSVAVS